MKVCIFTNHFYPEEFKVNDVAFELAKRGFDVTVFTAIPDYPKCQFISNIYESVLAELKLRYSSAKNIIFLTMLSSNGKRLFGV